MEGEKEAKNVGRQQRRKLDAVLRDFEGVFEEMKGLLSCREVDQKIPIKPGMEEVNLRSYRYPYLLSVKG